MEPELFRDAVKRLLRAFRSYLNRRNWQELEKSLINVYHDSVFQESGDRATDGTDVDDRRCAELLNLGVLSLAAVNASNRRVHYRFQGLASRFALAALFFHDAKGQLRADPLLERALSQLKRDESGGGEKFERLFARGLQVGANAWDLSRTWVSLAEMPLFAECAASDPSLWCYSLRVLTFTKHAADKVLGWIESGSHEEGSFMAVSAGPDVAVKATLVPFAFLTNAARHAISVNTEVAYNKFVLEQELPTTRLVLTQCKLFEKADLSGKARDHAVNTTDPAHMFRTKAGKTYQSAADELFAKSSYAAQCLRVLFVAGNIAAPHKIKDSGAALPRQHLIVRRFDVQDISELAGSLRLAFQPPWPPYSPRTPPTSRTHSETSLADDVQGEHKAAMG
jgi:hypothetical protein